MRPSYGRVDDTFVIVAVGPEAQLDRCGSERAVQNAVRRLIEVGE
jgi:hypothetical protein